MIGATLFLLLIIALVTRMVYDVQIAKVKHYAKEIERMQILAGIKPLKKKKKGDREVEAELTGIDIDGIEQLAERFQKLAHLKEDK